VKFINEHITQKGDRFMI